MDLVQLASCQAMLIGKGAIIDGKMALLRSMACRSALKMENNEMLRAFIKEEESITLPPELSKVCRCFSLMEA